MVRLLEPTHGPRFVVLMDRCMTGWRETRICSMHCRCGVSDGIIERTGCKMVLDAALSFLIEQEASCYPLE